jgi:hypothetical protein
MGRGEIGRKHAPILDREGENRDERKQVLKKRVRDYIVYLSVFTIPKYLVNIKGLCLLFLQIVLYFIFALIRLNS